MDGEFTAKKYKILPGTLFAVGCTLTTCYWLLFLLLSIIISVVCVCVCCVCFKKNLNASKPSVLSSRLFWTSSSLDVPAGVTQEEGRTGFFIHLPSAVRAFIFIARRIQPFLSLVDREVEFTIHQSFSTCWAFFIFYGVFFFFFFVCEEKS